LEEIKKGNFREDLYWRLNVVPVVMPPLRERSSDISLLLDFYVNKFNKAYERNVYLSSEAINCLSQYSWPGNVRELANTVERMVIMSEKKMIMEEDLPPHFVHYTEINKTNHIPSEKEPSNQENLCREVECLERRQIIKALKENKFVQKRASEVLGITPRQMGYRIKKYNIDLRKI
jgi:Nif-specific regulatory protein